MEDETVNERLKRIEDTQEKQANDFQKLMGHFNQVVDGVARKTKDIDQALSEMRRLIQEAKATVPYRRPGAGRHHDS